MLIKRLAETVRPTGKESYLGDEEIIVSKTDLQGHLTYCNDVFLRIAKITETDALGAPHCIIRHPDMPRSIFKLLWDALLAKREIFAYVNNLSADGNNYWVFAHVTPSFDSKGNVVGYHSSRRKPKPDQIAKIAPLYATLLDVERRSSNPKEAAAGVAALLDLIKKKGLTYDEFIFTV